MSASRTAIGIAEVERIVNRKRLTIWRWCRAGRFPQPFYIGDRRAWWADEVEAWRAKEIAKPAQVRTENLQNVAG